LELFVTVRSISVQCFNTSDCKRRLITSQVVVKIQGAFSERYHRIVTGRAQIEVYVLGNVESLITSTDFLQVFSFLHHVPWISTLTQPPLHSSLQRQATNSQLISKSSLRLRKNLPCQLPHTVANTSLNLQKQKHWVTHTEEGSFISKINDWEWYERGGMHVGTRSAANL
jgi:hypothetical protein